MKNILITGGTGLVGTQLSNYLKKQGYHIAFLSRQKDLTESIPRYQWSYKNQTINIEALQWADIIIHLAGYSVADNRWTKTVKKEIYDSRILGTRFLFDQIKKHDIKLDQFISASATGIYEFGITPQTEESESASSFLADVVKDWEKEIFKFEQHGTPTVAVRIGVVLSQLGGAFPQLIKPIKLGIGADLGTGKQLTPWIHISDLVNVFAFILENKLSGVYNAVSSSDSNSDLNNAFSKALNKKIWLPNIPPFVLKLLLGEMSEIVLNGSNISNKKIKSEGFNFAYPNLSIVTQALFST